MIGWKCLCLCLLLKCWSVGLIRLLCDMIFVMCSDCLLVIIGRCLRLSIVRCDVMMWYVLCVSVMVGV